MVKINLYASGYLVHTAPLVLAVALSTGCDSQQSQQSPQVPEHSSSIASPIQFHQLYSSMRSKILSITPEVLGITDAKPNETLALIVDWKTSPDAQATIVCLADGGSSVYLSNGGGIIGGIEHEHIRKQVFATLDLASKLISEFSPCEEVPLTEVKSMRFTIITPQGKLTAMDTVENLTKKSHPLTNLGKETQSVMTMLREISEQQRGQDSP